MIRRRISHAVLALVLLALITTSSAVAHGLFTKRLTVVGDHFELDGQQRFLVFVSYFDAMRLEMQTSDGEPTRGARKVAEDLARFKQLGIDGIRIFPMWLDAPAPPGSDKSFLSNNTVCDENGEIRPASLFALQRVITLAWRDFVVDVTFTPDTIPLPSDPERRTPAVLTMGQYKNCLRKITEALQPYGHVLFDISNESNLHGAEGRKFENPDIKALRDVIKSADPARIVVADVSGDVDTAFAKTRAQEGELDAIAYHDPRVTGWYTSSKMQPLIASLRTSGKPVYFQEPQKYSNDGTLTAANFREAVENAKRLGAAAWCFHTDAGFWMNSDQFWVDPVKPPQVEKDFLESFRGPLDDVPWGVNPQYLTPYYKIRLFTPGEGGSIMPVNGGGGDVHLRGSDPAWALFDLHDLNGGELRSGDRVTLRTWSGGYYLQDAGGALAAAGTQEGTSETFIVEKLAGDPPAGLPYPYRLGSVITDGDWIALRAAGSGLYVSPALNSPDSNVPVNASAVGFSQHLEFSYEADEIVVRNPNLFLSAPAQGIDYDVPIDALANRSWTATSNVSWITVQAPASGVGPGTITLQVAANPDPTTRTGQVVAADTTITVSQAALGCTFDVTPASNEVPRGGGTGTVNVIASSGACNWTATAADSWISITSGASGAGNGSVNYSVTANTSTSPRTGTLVVANRSVEITQKGNAAPVATITAPANGTIVERSTPITLSADATDSDGTVARVDFFVDGVKVGSDTTAPYSVVWSNAPAGWHTVVAEAFDDLGGAGSSAPVSVGVNNLDSVTVTPSSVRTGQAADITVIGVNPCGAVDLDFGDGTHTTFAIFNLPMTQQHVWTTAGARTVTATAHGNCAGIRTTTVNVAANAAPSVSLTSPANGSSYVAPAGIVLQATASDPETNVVRVDFYAGSTLIGSDSTSPYSYTWSGVTSGAYSITARAVDTEGTVGTSAAAQINVRDVGAVSASPSSVIIGQTSTVTVTGSPTCGAVQIDYGDGTVLTYPLSGLPTSQAHAWTAAGVKTIVATGQGNCAGTVTTTVTVAPNNPPSVSLTAPANGTVYLVGQPIVLTATASDSDGSIQRVEFYSGSTLIGTATSAPYTMTATAIVGTFSLTARAIDNSNASTTSAASVITVKYISGVSASPSSVVANQPSTVTVSGSASCSAVQINYGDGNVITYAISGLPTSQTHTWSTPGSWTITATGQGSCSGTATGTITVTTNPPPLVNITAPVNGSVYTTGTALTLSANASDPQGIQRVEFYAGGTLVGTDTTAPYAVGWNAASGTVAVFARAYDNYGAYSDAVAVAVTGRNIDPRMSLDTPANGATTGQPFQVGGWAVDLGSPSTTGIDAVNVYAFPVTGGAGIFLGAATYGANRPDLAASFGEQFRYSGFNLSASGLAPGSYYIYAYAHSSVTGNNDVRVAMITIPTPNVIISIDTPTQNQYVGQPFNLGGWAIDAAHPTESGVSFMHVYAYPADGSAPIFVGVATTGVSRPDVGNIYGARFTPSGFNLSVSGLAPGGYTIVFYPWSTVTQSFRYEAIVLRSVYVAW